MGKERERYKELGDFLKTRRKRLNPAQIELPAGPRRRAAGLSKEELAQLAGVSADCYTCLEQGRPIRVSAQVLENLAQILQLEEEERDYLFLLALQQPPPVDHGQLGRITLPVPEALQVCTTRISYTQMDSISPTILRMMDNLGICPAYVLDQCFNVLSWNRAAGAIFGDFSKINGRDRSKVWAMFAKPTYRQLYVNWEYQARLTLAQFRAAYGHDTDNKWLEKFVQELMEVSSEFKSWWHDCDVHGIAEGNVEFKHPQAGCLKLDHISFEAPGYPNLSLRVYTPVPGTSTAEKIKQLLETACSLTLSKKKLS